MTKRRSMDLPWWQIPINDEEEGWAMNTILKMITSNPLVQARIKQGIATASAVAGGWVLSHMLDWINAHLAFLSHADAMALASTVATCVAGLILVGGTAVFNIFIDPSNVNAKVIAAAATGNVQAANDPQAVAQTKEAVKEGTPEAMQELVAKLQQGKL